MPAANSKTETAWNTYWRAKRRSSNLPEIYTLSRLDIHRMSCYTAYIGNDASTKGKAMIIREGSQDEVRDFALWSEENEGETIEVAELDGQVVGFVQRNGAYIYFLESDKPGVGRALVDHVKEEMGDWLQACNVGPGCAGFWSKMGFEQGSATGERPNEFHYEWYAD